MLKPQDARIPAPLAIIAIILLALLTEGIVAWQYWRIEEEEEKITELS